MSSDPKAWKVHINAKIHQINDKTTRFILSPIDARKTIYPELMQSIAGLELMFSTPPPPVSLFKDRLKVFNSNQSKPNTYEDLLDKQRALVAYSNTIDSDGGTPSITFDSFWKAESLDDEYDQIIAILQKILNDAGEELTTKITRELEAILKGLKSVSRKDPYTMNAWVEIAARFSLEVLGNEIHIPGLSCVVDVAKNARGFTNKIVLATQKFEQELTNSYELKGTCLSMDQTPKLDKEERIKQIESKGAGAGVIDVECKPPLNNY